MADSIVRLKVDSQDYDNRIKRAADELQRYAAACKKAGGTLEYVDEEAMAFARDLGKMETVATSAKGKLREYTDAITALTLTYQQMTDAEKKGDWGKTLSKGIDEMKVKAAELRDLIEDTNMELKNMASDTAFSDGINLMTSTVGACTAAIVAWTGESKTMDAVIKDLAKIGTTVVAVEKLTNAIQKQNLALLKNPYVAATAAVLALGVAVTKLYKHMTELSDAEKAVLEVQKAGRDNAAQEVARIETLNNILHDNTRSLEERKTALSEIQSLVPDYHGALTTEGTLIDDNTTALDKYVQGLLRAATAQAAFDKMVDLQKQKMDAQTRLDNARRDLNRFDSTMPTGVVTGGAGSISGVAAVGMNRAPYQKAVDSAEKAVGEIDKQLEAVRQYVEAGDLKVEVKTKTTKNGKETEPTKLQEIQQKIADLSNEALTADAGRLEEIKSQIAELQKEETAYKNILDYVKGVNQESDATPLKKVQKEIADLSTEALTADEARREEIKNQIAALQQEEAEYKKILNYVNGIKEKEQVDPFVAYKTKLTAGVDTASFNTLYGAAFKNGIESLDVDFAAIYNRMLEGEDIPDEVWTKLEEQINAKLKELGIDPIKIDVTTGGIKQASEDVGKLSNEWRSAAQAVGQFGSALQSVEDPTAKIAGIIAQAIASVAAGAGSAIAEAGATGDAGGPWGWLAFAISATATMVSTIAAIKSATSGNYAQGGIIPGNSFSGDNLVANVNSGELILNRAQQDAIAGQLTQSPLANLEVTGILEGENIRLALVNNALRRGGSRGEYAITKFG